MSGQSTNIDREGKNVCLYEGGNVQPGVTLALAAPVDGTAWVTNNGPVRNFGITRAGGPDLRFEMLEDRIGDAGELFQGAFGFAVSQKAEAADPDPIPGFGVSIDDVLLQWREIELVQNPEVCICTGDTGSGDTDGDNLCDDIDPCPTDIFNDRDDDGVCGGADHVLPRATGSPVETLFEALGEPDCRQLGRVLPRNDPPPANGPST